MVPSIIVDVSPIAAYLQQPDVLLLNALPWVGGFLIGCVLIWGFFEVWLFNRQHHYRHTRKYIMLAVDVPKETEQSPKAMEALFATVAALWGGPNIKEKWIDGEVAPVISFELVGIDGYIQYYIRLEKKFRDAVESAIYAHYPDAEISEVDDYAHAFPDKFPDDNYQAWGTEFTLKKPSYFPIRTYESFEHRLSQELKDPLAVLLENLGKLKPGESIWLQFLISPLGPAANDWIKPGIKYVYEEIGKEEKTKHKSSMLSDLFEHASAFPGELAAQLGLLGGGGHEEEKAEDPWKFLRSTPIDKARLELVTQKISKPGMNTKIRLVYIGKHDVFSKSSREKMIKGMFNLYSLLDCNRFGTVGKTTPKHDYVWQKWNEDKKRTRIVRAYKHRDEEIGGNHFILNVEEMATLWHFPSILVRAPFISKTVAKRGEPPIQLPIEEVGNNDLIAAATEQKTRPVPLPIEQVEPTIPGRISTIGQAHAPMVPRHNEPAHVPHELPPEHHEAPPAFEEPALPHPSDAAPAPDEIPEAVRALFDPDVNP